MPIAVVVLLFSGPHMKDQPSFRNFTSVYNLPPEDAVPFGDTIRPGLIRTSMSGGRVYYEYYCIFCHGADGKGNGPVGQSYVPKPADLNDSIIKTYDSVHLYQASFSGMGHSPVLERVVPEEWKKVILVYINQTFIHTNK